MPNALLFAFDIVKGYHLQALHGDVENRVDKFDARNGIGIDETIHATGRLPGQEVVTHTTFSQIMVQSQQKRSWMRNGCGWDDMRGDGYRSFGVLPLPLTFV